MRLLYLSLFIVMAALPLMADDKKVHIKMPLEKSLPLLKSIENKGIEMGSGGVDVHVFIDPLCPHSRDFVEMIVESDKMRSKYHYYFYLYTLKRFHSEAVVASIYSAEEPLVMLKKVMVKGKEILPLQKVSSETLQKVAAIANVAKKLDVYKRPYMVMVKKPKKKRGN